MARDAEPQSADSVRRLFELSADMLGTATLDGHFTRLNPAWERILGWTREELMAEPFISFVHPDDVEATLARGATLADPERDAVTGFENRYRTSDGGYRHLQWTSIAEDGVLYFVVKDVTDRRAIEHERDEAAGMTRAITDSVPEGLYVMGRDGSILYVNECGMDLLGYEGDELLGLPAHSTLHHTHADGRPFPVEDCPLAGVSNTGVPYKTAEDCFWRKDGSMLPVAYSSSPVPLGTSAGTVVLFRDITADRAATKARREAELVVRSSEVMHRTLTGNLPDTSVYLLDRDLRILIADGEAIRRLPYLDEDMFRGRKVAELYAEVPHEVLQLCLSNYSAALQGERRAFEFTSEGLTFAIEAVPVRGDDDGEVESVLVVARDVTEHASAQDQIARGARLQSAVADLGRFALESNDLGELMMVAVTTVTATLDVDIGGVLEVNEAGESLDVVASVGFPDGLGRKFPVGDGAVAHVLETCEPTVIEDISTETRFDPPPVLHKLGVVSSVIVPIEGHDKIFGLLNVYTRERRVFAQDELLFLTAVARLIIVAVERDRQEQATRHAALHDPLTGLPNRTLALDRLAHALARRQRDHIDVAVFVVDVDGFKMINDSFGHAAGDDVLLSLAPRLATAVRSTDTVARLGGDEFVVICPDVDGARGATEAADRLAAAVVRPLVLDSGEHFFTITAGIALASTKLDTPESLLGDADAAMYRAKALGRGRYELFDEAMRTSAMERLRTENELRHALDRDQLEVWYQPVIDLATRRPVSTEALVRWRHPERGLVAPMEFISIAEETGLIARLGVEVLNKACRQTAIWQRDLAAEIGVSVNVSGRQVNPMFPAQVAAIAQESGVHAGTLALEITETVLMEDTESAEAVLSTFQEHGLTMVLDDFGIGYSSLSRLKHFPLDELKIDRSFVSGMETNADNRAIVKATIDMAHAVGLRVVAEGVETHEQEEYLRSFGCDRAQGYLYAKPQPAEAITELLAAAPR